MKIDNMFKKMLKSRRFLVSILVGIVAVIGMAWYINKYIYQFLAAFPKVNIEVKPYSIPVGSSNSTAISNIDPNQEFYLRVAISNQNIDGVDLYLTYDPTKVQYAKEYVSNYTPGSGYTQFPDQYFTNPVIEDVTVAGNNKQLRLVLMSLTTERKNLVHLNLKFKAIANGTANFTLESKSAIVGVDSGNNVGEFEKEPATPSGSITIGTGGDITVTSTITVTPIAPNPELIGHWKMDDNVTGKDQQIFDASGNGNNGKTGSINAAGVNCTTTGKYGRSCTFDGTDDYINVGLKGTTGGATGAIDPLWAKAKQSTVTGLYPWTNGGPTSGWESYITQWVYICNKSTCWIIDGSKNPREFVNNGVPFEMNTNPDYVSADRKVLAASDGTLPWTGNGPTAAWSYELVNGTTDANRLVTNIPKETIINEAVICNGKWCWRYVRPPNATDGYWRDGDDVDTLKGDPINLSTATLWKDRPELYTNGGPSVAWNDPVNKKMSICNGADCWTATYGNGWNWAWGGKVSPAVYQGTTVTKFTSAWTSPVTKTISLCNANLCHLFNLLDPVGYQASSTLITDGSGISEAFSDFTIEAWVNTTDISQTRRVVSSYHGSNPSNFFDLSINRNGNPSFSFRDAGGQLVGVTSPEVLQLNTWYHLAAVRDAGSTSKIYVNAVEKKSVQDTAIGSIGAYDGVFIGWDPAKRVTDAGYSFKGMIDDVRIYKTVRTAAQIKEDMDNNPGGTTITPQDGTITPTHTQTPGGSGSTKVNMKIRFQGVPSPKVEYSKQTVEIQVPTIPGAKQKVEFTHRESGVWEGSFEINNVPNFSAQNHYFLIKGPKHIQKKVCDAEPSEDLRGTYKCENGRIQLKEGTNDFDFSKIILLGGDLPNQDGVVNSLDFAFIRQNFGSTDTEVLKRGDLNLDGIIQTDDHTIIKTALEFKYDEE